MPPPNVRKTVLSPFALRPLRHATLAGFCILGLSGCNLIPPSEMVPPAPLQLPSKLTDNSTGSLAQVEKTPTGLRPQFQALPKPQASVESPSAPTTGWTLFPDTEPADITISVSNMTLPAFINEVFANQLKLNFQLAPELQDKKDLISLRVTEPRNRQGLFDITRAVLSDYGVVILQQDDYLRIALGQSQDAGSEPPLIVSGQALPSVPATHRPVVLVRDLSVLGAADAYSMLKTIFEREQRLGIQRDNNRSALVLQGPPELVQQAANILDSLDQPQMRGRLSLRINPRHMSAEDLSKNLTRTLEAQGFDIGEQRGRNTVLVPVIDLNSLFVFAPDPQTLDLVRQWSVDLDQPTSELAPNQEGTFWYRARETTAQELANTLNGISQGRSDMSTTSRNEDSEDRRLQGRTTTASTATGTSASRRTSTPTANTSNSGQFVFNQARNLLLYRGDRAEWDRMLPLIEELDKAPDQVMIEVIVAEVTLTDNLKFGVEWALSNLSVGGASGNLGSVFGDGAPGSGLNAGGLTWTSVSNSGQTRLALNAFASNDSVSILQTPRIMVRSGQSANVSVGSEVPIISRQSTSDEVAGILQDVQYRKTGITLDVTPTVYSDGRIDLEISQEVSQAAPTESSTINSPTILSRNLNTRLSLQDGSSILIGGLISNNATKGNSRIPILGDLPWIGHLFRVDSQSADRSELMVLIVPYLIKNGSQAEAITRAFRERLKLHEHIYDRTEPTALNQETASEPETQTPKTAPAGI